MLTDSSGNPLAGGSVVVTTLGQPSGQYAYVALANPITLFPNTTYALLSQEASPGDQWYDYSGTYIALSPDASGAFGEWAWNTPPPLNGAVSGDNQSYGPVNLQYIRLR